MRVYIKEFMPKMISKYLNLELQNKEISSWPKSFCGIRL